MKVCIFAPNLQVGGAEKVALCLANQLVLEGYLVELLLVEAKGELLKNVSSDIQVLTLGAKRLRNAFIPLLKYFSKNSPDILIAIMWPLTSMSILAKYITLSSTKVIVSEHTTWSRSHLVSDRLRRYLVRLTMAATFPFADSIVTVSQGAKRDLAGFALIDEGKITTIYNPVELLSTSIHSSPIVHRWPEAEFKLLAVGKLKAVKRFDILIKAVEILVREYQVSTSLLILGDGEERCNLESLVSSLNLSEIVSLPGEESFPFPYYKEADVFVLSSENEGFGNVIVEALSAGTKVVSTDCLSGPSEILERGRYGWLVDVNSPLALALGIQSALEVEVDEKELILRSKSFDSHVIIKSYMRLFDN